MPWKRKKEGGRRRTKHTASSTIQTDESLLGRFRGCNKGQGATQPAAGAGQSVRDTT